MTKLNLIETVDTLEVSTRTYYLDKTDNGKFVLSKDETVVKVYDNEKEAHEEFEQLRALLTLPLEVKTNEKPKCKIFGADEISDFLMIVNEDELRVTIKDIWNNPMKYRSCNPGKVYYEFLNFLWIKHPDGREEKLTNLI